jgi:hypothetical protein
MPPGTLLLKGQILQEERPPQPTEKGIIDPGAIHENTDGRGDLLSLRRRREPK